MQKARLTLNCIKKFSPTKDKPLVVSCGDGYYRRNCAAIKIVGWNDSDFIFRNCENDIKIWTHSALEHFPSPYQPVRRYRVLYFINSDPVARVSSGYYVDEKDFLEKSNEYKGRDLNVFIQLIKGEFVDE